MHCCNQEMLSCKYFVNKHQFVTARICTTCGKLVTYYGLRIWRGRSFGQRKGNLLA